MSTMKSLHSCLTRSYPLTRNVIEIKHPHITRQSYKLINIGAGFSPSCGHRKCKTIAAHLETKVKCTNQSNVLNGRHSSKGNSIGYLTRKNKFKHAHHCMKLTRSLSTKITERRPNPNAAPDTNPSRNNLSGSANSMASFVHTKLPTSESNKNKTSTNESEHETDNCSLPSFGEFLSGEYSRDPLVRKESLIPVPADFQLPTFTFLSKESKGCGKLKHAHHCMKLTRNLSTNTTEKSRNPNVAPHTNSSRNNLSGSGNIMASFTKLTTSEKNKTSTNESEQHETDNWLMPSFGEFLSGDYSCQTPIRKESLIPVLADFQLPSYAFLSKESKGCGIFTVSAAKNHKKPEPCEDDCLNKISELAELDSKPVLCQNFNHPDANFVEKMNCDHDLVILNKDGLKCFMAPIIPKDKDIEQNNTSSDLKSDLAPSPDSINTEVLKNFRNEMEILGNTPSDCIWKNLEVVADIKEGNDISETVNVNVSIIPSKCTENKDFTDLTKIEPEKIEKVPYRSPHSNSISSIINSVDKSAVIIQKDLYITNRILDSLEKKKEEDKKSNQPKIELFPKLDFDNFFELDLRHEVRPQECGLSDNIIVSKTIKKPNKALNSFKNYLSAAVPTNSNNKCPKIQKRETHSKSAVIIQKDLYMTNGILDSLEEKKEEDKKINQTKIEPFEILDFDNAFELDLCHEVRPQECGLSDNIIVSKTIKKPNKALNSFKNYLSAAVPTNSNNKCPKIQKRETHSKSSANKPPDQTNPTANTTNKTVITSTKSENRTEILVQEVQKFIDKRIPFPFCTETVFQVSGSNEKLGESVNVIESLKAKLAMLNSENSKNSLASQLSFKNMLSSIKSGYKKSEDKSVVIPIEDVKSKPHSAIQSSTIDGPNSVMSFEEFAKKTKHAELMRLARAIKMKMPSNRRQHDKPSKRLTMKRHNLGFRKCINRRSGTDSVKRPFRESNEKIKLMTPKQIDAILGIKPKSGNENEKPKLQIRVVGKDKKTKKVVVKPRPVDNSTEIKQGSAAKPVKDDKWFVKKEESKPIMKLLPVKITDVKNDNKMKTDTLSKSNDNTKLDDKDESLSARDRQILKEILVSRKNEREKPSSPSVANRELHKSYTPGNNEKQLFSPIVKPPKSEGAVRTEIRIIKGEKELKKEKEDAEKIIKLLKAVQNKTIAEDKLDPKLKLSKATIDTKRIVELFKAKIDSYEKSAKGKTEVPKKSTEDIKAESKTDKSPGNPRANIAESKKINNVKSDPNLNIEIQVTSKNKSAVDSKTDPKMEAKSENFQGKSRGSDEGKSVKSDPNVKVEIQLTSQSKSPANSKDDPKLDLKSKDSQKKNTSSFKGKNLESDPNFDIEIQLTSENKFANAKTEKPISDTNIVTKESTDAKMTLKELKKEKQEAGKIVKLLKDLAKISAVKDKLDTKNKVKESVKGLTKSSGLKDKLDTTNNAKEPVKSSPAPKPTPGDKPHVVTRSERLTAILPKPLEVTRNKFKSQISESEGQTKPENKIITRTMIEKIKKAPMESPIFTAANSITESEKELLKKIDKSLLQSKTSKQIELIDDFYLGKLDTSMSHPEVLLLKAKKSFVEIKKQASKIGKNDEKYSPSSPQTKSRGNLGSIPKQLVHTLNPRKVDIPQPPTSTQINLESSMPIHNQPEIKAYQPALKEDLAMNKILLESSKSIQIKGAALKAYEPALKEELAMSKFQLESSKPFQIKGAELKPYKPALKEDLAMNKIHLESSKSIKIKGAASKTYKPALKEELAMSKFQLESSNPSQINGAKLKDYKLALKEDLAMNKMQLDSPKPIQIKGAELKEYKPDLKEDLAANKIQLESSKPIQINGADLKAYMKPTIKENKLLSETRKTCLINWDESNFEFKEDLVLYKFKEYASALKNSKITATYVLPRPDLPSLQPIKSSICPSLGKLDKTAEIQKKIKDRNCDLMATFAEQEISKMEVEGYYNQDHLQSSSALHHFEETQQRLDDDLKRMQQKLSKFEINLLKDSLSKMTIDDKGRAIETSSKQNKIDVNKENKKRIDNEAVDHVRRATYGKKMNLQTKASTEDKRDALDRAIKERILNKMDLKPLTRKSESEKHLIKTNFSDKNPELIADLPPISSLLSLEDELLKTKVEEIWPPLEASPSTAKSQLPERDFMIDFDKVDKESIPPPPLEASLSTAKSQLPQRDFMIDFDKVDKESILPPPLEASPSTAISQLPERDFMIDFDKVSKESIPPLDIRMCKICPTPEHRILSFPMNNLKKKYAVHNPITGVLSIDPNKNVMLKKAMKTLPSVTTILNATMGEDSKLQLTKWRSSIISQLGQDGFKKFYSEQLQKGNEFHGSIHSFLNKFKEPGKDVHHYTSQCFKSIKDVLKNISDVSVVESLVVHPQLAYRGVIDCIAKYKNKNVIIEWKRSDKSKPTIHHTFDVPLQLSAYIGALSFDPAYDMQVEGALVVVAYSDGTPADVFNISLEECEFFWKKWLLRYKNFFANHQGFPFGDVK